MDGKGRGPGAMSAPVYNRDIWALAVATADFPLLVRARRASLRAPLCGSRIVVDVDADRAGTVRAVGLHVEACALGQASAALLARHAPEIGRAACRERVCQYV